MTTINPQDVADLVERLRSFNAWRRGKDEDAEMPSPRQTGKDIDAACSALEALMGECERLRRDTVHGYVRETGKTNYATIREALSELSGAHAMSAVTSVHLALVKDRVKQTEAERDALAAKVEWLEAHAKQLEEPQQRACQLQRERDERKTEQYLLADQLQKMDAVVEAARGLEASFFSHIDGRDLIDSLCPSGWHHCDIQVRIGGRDVMHEGDWLKNVWYARRPLRNALSTIDGDKK